jgi:SAM-dependent methyltransferase
MSGERDRPPVIDYEGSDYQTTFWDQGGRAYEDQAEARALQALLPKAGRLLLDIGAGAGRNVPRYTGFDRIVLFDYSRTQLAQAQARLGRSERYLYVAGDVYRLPFVPGLFDTAVMIRVMHHLADAPAALCQIRAVLKPGAAGVLEFASKLNLKAIARWLARRQSWNPFDPAPVEFVKLNFDFHPGTMLAWLRAADLPPQRIRALSYFRLGLLKRLFPTWWLVGLDSLLQPTGQWVQLSPSVFVRTLATGESLVAPAGKFFRCPECGGDDLNDTDGHLRCEQCGRRWPLRDGIYDFKEPMPA